MTDQTAEDKGTLYHPSVKDFRATLVKAAAMYNATSKEYQPQVMGAAAKARETSDKTIKIPAAVGDAYRGSLGAYSYAYTLAAIIRYAGRRFGDEVARELACVADDLLMNGDDDNLNGDIPEAAGC